MTDLFEYSADRKAEPRGDDDFPTPEKGQQPDRVDPVGPVWWLQTGPDSPLLRVRSLPSAPGLLRLGALLRHSAKASHPRLRVPTIWWRENDKTWLATPAIDAAILQAHSGPRPTWSQAVEAITPLCVALQRAHRRGLIHGHLSPWNVCVDGDENTVFAYDFGTLLVEDLQPGPFCAPELENGDAPGNARPATDIYNLARLLIHLAIGPEEAQRARPNFETLPAYAIPALERALSPEPARRPQTIDEFLSAIAFHGRSVSHPPGDGDTLISGRIADRELFEHERRGRGIRFRLAGTEDRQPRRVFVYADQHPEIFDSLVHTWEGAELIVYEPRRIEDSRGRVFFTAQSETVPVVEPNWVVSVSDVLKARGCPQRVMVDLRDPGEFTHHLAFGNLVHGFLEDLTEDESITFEEALESRLPNLHLDFLAAGVDDAKLAELTDRARTHFTNLQRFTARRTNQADKHDRVGWYGELAEATRYSSRYGLEGRTDLVVTDGDEGLQIIELKSGKPWHDHPGQVQSYALLWRALADEHELPTSGYLLYSKTGRMKEVPLDGRGDPRGLLEARNQLVALYRSFVDPDFEYRAPHYMEHPALCRENACRFRRDRCAAQTELLGLNGQSRDDWKGLDEQLVERARRYNDRLTRLIETERWAAQRALGAIFDPNRLSERTADGVAAAQLTLSPSPDASTRYRAVLTGQNLHIFTAGDRLLLHRGDVNTRHILRARVVETWTDGMEIHLRAAQMRDEFAGPGWIADIMPSRIGHRTAHRALYRILESKRPDLLDVLLRPEQDVEDVDHGAAPPQLDDGSIELLNDSQIDAVRQGLDRRPATLIQGPPGTGKTTVIAHLSFELARRDQSVLLSALTNTAVDTMLIKLLDAADALGSPPPPFVRLGSADRSPLLAADLRRRGLPAENYFSDDLARRASSLSSLASHLEGTLVVATTAHSALRHPAMRFFERRRGRPAFDVALVDEASQLTEPMALAPICSAQRFVLVGDHHQLPPIVTSERALSVFVESGEDEDLQAMRLAGLDQSLFERLANFLPTRLLTTQYRMNEAIMDFPARHFYDGRLKAHESVAYRELTLSDDKLARPLSSDSPVLFVDVDGDEVGRTNRSEAKALLKVASQLGQTAPEATVGILSPFRAQVHLLRRLSVDVGLAPGVDIDTVERFQGNERDVILASLVKTDHPGDFLSDVRRLNVALTRARKKLIIFGHRSCLEQDPTFKLWLDSERTALVSWKQ